jgi:hypothetical protein
MVKNIVIKVSIDGLPQLFGIHSYYFYFYLLLQEAGLGFKIFFIYGIYSIMKENGLV